MEVKIDYIEYFPEMDEHHKQYQGIRAHTVLKFSNNTEQRMVLKFHPNEYPYGELLSQKLDEIEAILTTFLSEELASAKKATDR